MHERYGVLEVVGILEELRCEHQVVVRWVSAAKSLVEHPSSLSAWSEVGMHGMAALTGIFGWSGLGKLGMV